MEEEEEADELQRLGGEHTLSLKYCLTIVGMPLCPPCRARLDHEQVAGTALSC